MNRRFWAGKRAYVTGHTGFKGSWLSAWLLDAGASVAGYALEPTSSRAIFSEANLAGETASTFADIRDARSLKDALLASRPDVVFHLAAQPLVRESYERPIETFDINVVGTANLLDAVRSAPSVRAVVVVTSDKCYAQGEPGRRHAEEDALGGSDPYSASKAGAEYVAASYRTSFFGEGAGVATARAGNVIGGGDIARDRLVPDLLSAFEERRPAQVRRPDAIRPWQHVLDPLSGYVSLAQALHDDPKRFASAWNFGPPADHEVSVGELADMAVRLWGPGAGWQRAGGEHPHETAVLRLDSTKAGGALGWQGRVPLESALGWTIEWQRDRARGESARGLLRREFERFESLASVKR